MAPIRRGDGTGIGSIRLGDGTEVSEVRTGDGDTVFTAGPDVPDDTIAYWPGDEGTGTTLTDKVGTADLTINGPTWVSNPDFKGGFGLDFGPSRDDSNSVTGTAPTPTEFSWFIRVNLDELVNAQPGIRGIIDYQTVGRGDYPLLQYIFANAGLAFRFGTSGDDIRVNISPSGTVTAVGRLDNTSTDLDVFDDSGSNIGSNTGSGGTQTYQSSTVELGQVDGARDWQGEMDPNWMLLDKRVSDTEMNNIINQYYS